MNKIKIYQKIRKVLSYLPLSFFEKRLILKPFKSKKVYNHLVIPDKCFKSSSKEIIIR